MNSTSFSIQLANIFAVCCRSGTQVFRVHEYHLFCLLQEWDPSIPGLAVCERSRLEVVRWAEQRAGQQILLTTPTVVVGYRAQVYRSVPVNP